MIRFTILIKFFVPKRKVLKAHAKNPYLKVLRQTHIPPLTEATLLRRINNRLAVTSSYQIALPRVLKFTA